MTTNYQAKTTRLVSDPLRVREDVADQVGNKRVVIDNRLRDVTGRLKTSNHQNVYDADFEYGTQPLRWENITVGSGTVTHLPGQGGVRLRVTTASGDMTIRQSRPYHRYQPGKTMFMATAVNFGTTQANQTQRVGFFDDSNGVFFEQTGLGTTTNPYGIFLCYRSDVNSVPTDTRIAIDAVTDPYDTTRLLDWTRIQMLFIEYAWYGAGALRWGVFLDGEPYTLHEVGVGNKAAQLIPWARTGNLPVRYEQRNSGVTALANDMIHYGVSVMVEGGIDEQRGFTYSYGMALQTPRRTVASNTTRYPVLSFRIRPMGTIEATQANSAATAGTTTTLTVTGTPWTTSQWVGRAVFFPTAPMPAISSGAVASLVGTITFASAHGLSTGQTITITGSTPSGWNGTWGVTVTGTTTCTINFPIGGAPAAYTSGATVTTPIVARITANTSSQLTFVDVATGLPALTTAVGSGVAYQLGLINRGQILPRRLLISASALAQCEIISSTSSSPVSLVGSSFAAMNTLGSAQSLVERDVSATAMSGGEVVAKFTLPAGGSGLQDIDLSTLFPLFNTIRGNVPDVLTLAVTTQSGTASDVGADFQAQEAMS